jgi:drug/metabolite transporter (DMT)-like permease
MVIWGSAAVFLRTLALALAPENSLALRYALLTAVNAAGLLILGTWRIRRADWWRFLVTGLVGMGGYNWFVNAGFALVPAGLGTIITMVEPFMIAVLAWMLLQERVTAFLWAGVAISSCGAIVLFWKDLAGTAAQPVPIAGVVYLMLSCAAWAIYTVLAKPLLGRYDSFTVTAVTMTIAAPPLIAAASAPLLDLARSLDGRQWAELMYLVIPNGILGTMLWNYGTKHLGGASTGAFLYLIPVVAVICGAIILSEPVTPQIVAGGALILAGVALAQFGPNLLRAGKPAAE